MQEALRSLFTVGEGDAEHAAAKSSPAERAAGRLSLCLTFLSHAAAMPASLRRCAAVHGLPAVLSIACDAAYPVVVSSCTLRQQVRTAVLTLLSVCSTRCGFHQADAEQVSGETTAHRHGLLCWVRRRSADGAGATSCWLQSRLFLVQHALAPHPFSSQLVADVWCAMLR